MHTAVAEVPPSSPARNPRGVNGLLTHASPLIELVLKIQTGVVEPSNDLRPLTADLLRQLERGAAQLGYDPRHAESAAFAVVAFLDETVLSPERDFPVRSEWENFPIGLDTFGRNVAGEEFFERLEAALAAGEDGLDAGEVYYVCLLLGFKGKYYLFEEQLRRADDQPAAPARAPLPLWAKVGVPALVGFALFVYVVLYLLLQREFAIAR